jgi:valyl-tRNA synthetase
MHMSKMSIADAAEYFGVSKEAIHNRIRRGSLDTLIEDGVKQVVIDPANKNVIKPQMRKTAPPQDDRYYKLLEEQNVKLQEKVEKLENETRSLREQKEQMLIEERLKIEQIYKDKDEQLKNILNAITSNFMLNPPVEEKLEELDHVEAEIEESPIETKQSKLISLKKYLKDSGLSKSKRDKVQNRFEKIAKKDKRIIVLDKKLYIDLARYDYKDLL